MLLLRAETRVQKGTWVIGLPLVVRALTLSLPRPGPAAGHPRAARGSYA